MTTVNLFSNRATAKLAVDVASNDTALTLVPGGGALFPPPGTNQRFRLVLQKGTGATDQREYMICTGLAGDVLTVTRAQEGTVAANFAVGDEVSLVATAASLTEFVQRQGVTMQGALEVEADPTTPLGVATKKFVETGRLADAPSDGKDYARNNAAWHALGAAASLPVPIPIGMGGTGGISLSEAQANLYIPKTTFDDLPPATPKYGDRWIKPSNMTELVWAPNAGGGGAGIWINPADATSQAYPITIDHGGTGATTLAGARLNLGITNAAGQMVITPDGTVAAPGLAFASEPGLGWYRFGASGVSLVAQGATLWRTDASVVNSTSVAMYPRTPGAASVYLRNVPFGTANLNQLQLAQNADGSAAIATLASGTNTRGTLAILAPYTSVVGGFAVDTSSLVGSNASIQLVKNAATNASDIYGVLAPNLTHWLLRLGNGAPTDDFAIHRYNDSGAIAGNPININRSTGVVTFPETTGVNMAGTLTAPAYLLTGGQAAFNQDANSVYLQMSANWYWYWAKATGVLAWVPNGTNQTTFNPNGDFTAGGSVYAGGSSNTGLIGGSQPFIKFTADNWRLQWAGGNLYYINSGNTTLVTLNSGGDIIANGAVYAGNGAIGMNSVSGGATTVLRFSSDNWRFWWNGGNWFWSNPSNTNLYTFGQDGNAQKYAGPTTWTVTSDRRIKRNIEDYTGGLEDILALRPRVFKFIPDEGNEFATEGDTHVGLVADEAETVMPKMVKRGRGKLRDGTEVDDLAQMNIDPAIYSMMNAIKTLHARVQKLEMQ